MRIPFNAIFEVKDNKVTNKTKIKVSGITAEAGALREYQGQFLGVDFSLFKERDLDVKTDGDTWVILGIY